MPLDEVGGFFAAENRQRGEHEMAEEQIGHKQEISGDDGEVKVESHKAVDFQKDFDG